METINWQRAIERNREALVRIVETLFSIAGLDGRDAVATLPRATRNYVLRILRPAESAVRRLIVVAARGIKVAMRSPSERKRPRSTSVILGLGPRTHSVKPAPSTQKRRIGIVLHHPGSRRDSGMDPLKQRRRFACLGVKPEDAVRGETSRPIPTFPLIDPRKRFDFGPPRRYARTFPRISIIGVTEPRPIPEIVAPTPGDPLDATRICRRLHALKRALDDLDGQAKRLARREARRKLLSKPGENTDRKVLLEPMRPGYAPGRRKRPRYDIDEVLRECHSLAVYARSLDTS